MSPLSSYGVHHLEPHAHYSSQEHKQNNGRHGQDFIMINTILNGSIALRA